MLAAVMESVGGGFGYVFNLFFVSPDDINDIPLAKDHIFNLCIASAVILSFLFIVALVIFRQKPMLPPTY